MSPVARLPEGVRPRAPSFVDQISQVGHKGMLAAARMDYFINSGIRKVIAPPLKAAMNRSARARELIENVGKNQRTLLDSLSSVTTIWTGVSLLTKYSLYHNALPVSAQQNLDTMLGNIPPDLHAATVHGLAVVSMIASLRIASAFLQEAVAQTPPVEDSEITNQFESAPVLTQWMSQNQDVRETVTTLETRLRADSEFLKFLGFDAQNFSLLDVLGEARLLETTDLEGAAGTNKAYDRFNACTVINLADHATLTHELLHLLHFQALKRAMDAKTIGRVLSAWGKDIPKKFSEHTNVARNLEILSAQNQNQEPTETERQAGMELFLLYADITGRADYLEAIPSRYRYDTNDWKKIVADLFILSLYPATVAVSLLGGSYFLNRQLNARLGYNFPKYVNRYFGKGLIDSVLS